MELKDGAVPARVRAYPQTDEANEFIESEITNLLEADIIESSVSPWSAPCLVVTKCLPNNKIKRRLVIDYRSTNKTLKDVFYDLPSWEELYAMLNKYRPKLMISLDLRSAYHSVKIHPSSWPISAFSASLNRKYCYKRASFGMKTSSAYFCQLINQILTLGDQNHKLLNVSTYAFVDDLYIRGRDVDDLCKNLAEVLRRLRAANVKLTGDKVVLATKSVSFLGSEISIDGISMREDKVAALVDTPVPTNLKELKSAMGAFSYYRKYIRQFALLTDKMYGLMKKNTPFIWTKAINDDWEALKQMVKTSPILSFFDKDDTLYLYTDASGGGIGWFLCAEPPDKSAPPKLIRAGGHRLEPPMRLWGISSLETAAVVSAVTALRTLIKGRKVIVVTDHSAIGHIMNSTKQPPTGRLQRYATILQDYDLEFGFLPGKYNIVADHLSRRPYDKDTPARSQEEKEILHESVASLSEASSLKHPLDNIIRATSKLETRTKKFPGGGCRNTNPNAKADFTNFPAVKNLSENNIFRNVQGNIAIDVSTGKVVCTAQQYLAFSNDKDRNTCIMKVANATPHMPSANANCMLTDESIASWDQVQNSNFQYTNFEKLLQTVNTMETKTARYKEGRCKNTNLDTFVAPNVSERETYHGLFNMSVAVANDVSLLESPLTKLETIPELPEPHIVCWTMLYTDDEDREACEDLLFRDHEVLEQRNSWPENEQTSPKLNALDEGQSAQTADEIHKHDMHKLQRACPELGPMIRFLETNDLSDMTNAKLAAQISVTAPEYFLNEKGVLYHLTINNNKVKELEPILETLVIPISLRNELVQGYHTQALCHLGLERVFLSISRHYWFPQMYNYIRSAIKYCLTCQLKKVNNHIPKTPLRPISLDGMRVGQRWSIDVFSPLVKSQTGFTKILTIIDHASGFPFAIPMYNETASSIVGALIEAISQFGTPRIIQFDRSQAHVSNAMTMFLNTLGVKRCLSSPYASASMGLVERCNQNLSRLLRNTLQGDNDQWDKRLPLVLMALRGSTGSRQAIVPLKWLLAGLC